ncbi:unnamed protein product, partial [Allacma fusca]
MDSPKVQACRNSGVTCTVQFYDA